MARLFTIYFEFKGVPYNALVSVRANPFYTEYTLNHFDDQLIHQLPGNKIIATQTGKFFFQNAEGMESTSLMKEILSAVSRRLQGSEV